MTQIKTGGMFINTEGIDGSGTSTMVHRLSQRIEDLDKYQDVLRTHEPWRNAEIKRRLEQDKDAYSGAEEMSDLYIDDRTDHSYILIRPNLDANTIVLNSRYKPSTCAFQWAQGVPLEILLRKHANRKGILTPDANYFLDVDRKVAAQRMSSRAKQEKFEKNPDFIDQAIQNYRDIAKIAKRHPNLFGPIVTIDANQSLEEVERQVFEDFEERYKIWTGELVYWGNINKSPSPILTLDQIIQDIEENFPDIQNL